MDCGIDGLTFKRPSLCKPQFAAECDLKGVVQRFLKHGELPGTVSRPEFDGDATQFPDDFQALMDHNVQIRQQFDLLPLEERNKYNNDPEAWAAEQIAKADGMPTPADGTPTPADGTPTPADGTPTPADGTPTPADGTPEA